MTQWGRFGVISALSVLAGSALALDPTKPILAREPAVGGGKVVFVLGTDLWSVPLSGGEAVRLTVGSGQESNPSISPDGKWVAFSGQYDGNTDAFVMPIGGGTPKRLTYHPGGDAVVGWTPDGKQILVTTGRDGYPAGPRFYQVEVATGKETAVPLPRGNHGTFSPDGKSLAYVPISQWQPSWKRYRGGQATPIWIADLATSKVSAIPRKDSNDSHPMWVGGDLYFLSDREGGSKTLYRHRIGSGGVQQLLPPQFLGIKSAAYANGKIVLERLGSLSIYDLETGKETPIKLQINGDFPATRTRVIELPGGLSSGSLSPSAARVAISKRGEIFTIPAAKGDARNLTNTSGVAERDPIWSPDGKSIAYLSDASGNYKLVIAPQDGKPAETYDLGDKPGWADSMAWSPDGKKIVYVDQDKALWVLDIASRKNTKIDQDRNGLTSAMQPNWSPDSKWIVYCRYGSNRIQNAYLYNMETGKSTPAANGLSAVSQAAFDRNGKYLYLLASNDVGQGLSFADMNSLDRPISRNVYMVVLNSKDPSPFLPESDEEKGAPAGPPPGGPGGPPAAAGGPSVVIDFDGMSQRILSLPLPSANYVDLIPTTPGSFLVVQTGMIPSRGGMSSATLFQTATRRAIPFANGVFGVGPNASGSHVLLLGAGGPQIVPTAGPPQPGQGALSVTGLSMRLDPKAEWRQMVRDAWRMQRDFGYDPNSHGIDIDKATAYYMPFVENVTGGADLNYLMDDMLNEMTISHMFAGADSEASAAFVPGGLLGADYRVEANRHKVARVYTGENWNPGLRAPLTQPGNAVKEGEFILAINGKEITASQSIYEALEGTANKQVKLTVGPNPSMEGSREVTIVPLASEGALRTRAWVEDNRRMIDKLSGGKIGYIHVPDTANSGFAEFNRYFIAQLDKEAIIIDDRNNSGGLLSDYIADAVTRRRYGFLKQRAGDDTPVPGTIFDGPTAMLINEMAGSGGDALPWFYKTAKAGPLIGKRTWGGLVGVARGIELIGGGWAGSPASGVYGLDGQWYVENHGVDPDIDVDEDPALWRQGRDAQIERAVAYLLEELKKRPAKTFKSPAYPNYHRNTPIGKSGG